jgi:hypothetical protein
VVRVEVWLWLIVVAEAWMFGAVSDGAEVAVAVDVTVLELAVVPLASVVRSVKAHSPAAVVVLVVKLYVVVVAPIIGVNVVAEGAFASHWYE